MLWGAVLQLSSVCKCERPQWWCGQRGPPTTAGTPPYQDQDIINRYKLVIIDHVVQYEK